MKYRMESQGESKKGDALSDGYDAAINGSDEKANCYEPGTNSHALWMQGFQDGQSDRTFSQTQAAQNSPSLQRYFQQSMARSRREE